MSLQVWLPLNGNITNQGLSNISITNNGVTSNSNGKIGSTFHFTESGYCTLSSAIIPSESTDFSCAYWVKENSNNTVSSFRGVYNCGNFLIGQYGSNFNVYNTSGGCDIVASIDSTKWNHCCVTFSKDKVVRLYINGELAKEGSATSFPSSGTVSYIGRRVNSGTNQYNDMYLNDFRIYDHCLSAKEVSEIAKGLVLHYPLSSQYETGTQNKYSGEVAAGKCTSGSFTVTKLTDERGYNYKLTYTGNGNDNWPSCKFGNFSFTAGKKYYYSVKVRCHSKNFNIQLRASRSDNDWVTNMVNILNPDGEWHEYHVYQTVNETYNRSGSTVTCNPVLEFYSESLKTADKVYSVDFDVKDVQVIESDCYVPFIENSYCNSAITDCSGLANNGTRSGTLVYTPNSIRYDGCLEFAAISYIKIPKPMTISNASQFTVSMWVMPQSGCGGYATVLSNYNNPASGFWMAINTEGSGTWFYNGTYAKGGPLLTVGAWSHIAMVFNAGTITWYVNGAATTTSNVSSKTTQFTDYIAIGNSYTGTTWNTNFVGKLSDVRIYTTALSADDIKQLYSSPISIDKSGNLYAYEFKEV